MSDEHSTPTAFARNLKQQRNARGWTQKKLAEMVKVSTQTISEYERATTEDNKGKNPTLDNAIAIARALSVSLDTLCGIERSSEKSLGEVARELIYMLSFKGIEYTEYPMPNEEPDAKFPSKKYKRKEYRYAQCPALVVTDSQLKLFLQHWQQLLLLLQKNVIDKEIYDGCLSPKFAVLDKHTAIPNGIADAYEIPDFDEERKAALEQIEGKPDF